MKHKDGIRFDLVCGKRALAYMRKEHDACIEVSCPMSLIKITQNKTKDENQRNVLFPLDNRHFITVISTALCVFLKLFEYGNMSLFPLSLTNPMTSVVYPSLGR